MLTKEDVLADDEEIIKDLKHAYKVSGEDGEYYKCKYCGESIDDHKQIAPHTKQCEEAPEDAMKRGKGKSRQSKGRDDEDSGESEKKGEDVLSQLTFNDEISQAMVQEFLNQLKITPGAKNSKDKINWIVRWFASNSEAKKNPQKLYQVISKNFGNMNDEAINLIVDSVFDVKNQYHQERRGYQGKFARGISGGASGDDMEIPEEVSGDPNKFAMYIMYQLYNEMRGSGGGQGGLTEEDVEKRANEIAEKKKLESDIEHLKERMNLLQDQQDRPSPRTEGDWSDDWARLTYEALSQGKELLQTIISDNKKYRTKLLKMLLQGGEGAGLGSGASDEEITESLEKEGLVEEE